MLSDYQYKLFEEAVTPYRKSDEYSQASETVCKSISAFRDKLDETQKKEFDALIDQITDIDNSFSEQAFLAGLDYWNTLCVNAGITKLVASRKVS